VTRSIRPRARVVPEEVRALLEERAARLRAPPPADDDEEVGLWLAEFHIGGERYALPLASLRAALPLRLVTPVPLSPPHVIGVLRFQGQVIAAVSIASLLGVRGWRQDPAVLLVVDPGFGPGANALTALDCEEIPRAITVPQRLVDDALAGEAGPVHELHLGDDLVHYVDPARLLDRRSAGRHG
jgi:purine-binding chemotaxis protein CheW